MCIRDSFQDVALEPRQLEERLRQIRADMGPPEESSGTESQAPSPSVKKKMM